MLDADVENDLQTCRDIILKNDSFDFEALFFGCSQLLFNDLKKYVDEEIERNPIEE